MSRRAAELVTFAATVALALIAAALVAAGAAAQEPSGIAAEHGASVQGTASWPRIDAGTAEALKSAYLACDRAATQGRLDAPTIMSCSEVAETVQQRVFGGSFDALLGWWRAARARPEP